MKFTRETELLIIFIHLVLGAILIVHAFQNEDALVRAFLAKLN